MVTQELVPQPPSWMRRQQEQGAPSANRNINDIYWQKPDGWIVVGPSAVRGANGRYLTTQAESWERKGYRPLVEYSYTDRISDKTGHRETIETNADRLNTPDRYYWLFRNGGAHLFPIEQIVEHHWHINPPYGLPKSVFPQLSEWEVPEPRWCPNCPPGRAPMNSDDQVVKHLLVMHQPMTAIQAGEMLKFAKEPPRPNNSLIRRKADEVQAAAQAELAAAEAERPKLSICNQCGEPVEDKPFAMARHVKSAHPKANDASPAEGREDENLNA